MKNQHGKLSRNLGLALIITSVIAVQGCAPAKTNDVSTFSNDKPEVSANVIYGSDGRLDIYQVSDERLKKLADSTVALIENSNLITSGNNISIKGSLFGASYGLCSTEKFREQSTAAFCSGSLVGEDTIITAGHCVKDVADCAKTSFVFGYAVKVLNLQPTSTVASEVYKCKSIIKQVLTGGGADFAVIKLDRKVPNHAPLEIRKSGESSVGDPLIVIGHPTGLPTKITTGGKVRSIASASHLVASVDTYGGNSGSAVFNANTNLIEGILVRGENDFVQLNGCTVSQVCAEGACRGEDITRISLVKSYIPTGVTPPPPPPDASSKYSAVVNLSIPDNNATGIQTAIAADKIPGARKVYVSIDISHTYIGDLTVQVVSPSGKIAVLHSRAGAGTDNLKKTFEVTSALGSESKIGNYKISVKDLAKIDAGFLNSWAIEFK